jgi:lipopolysaccharide/colanic/teichoic acid biosynthesis glycosyltransferase
LKDFRVLPKENKRLTNSFSSAKNIDESPKIVSENLRKEIGEDAFSFIIKYGINSHIIATTTIFNILQLPEQNNFNNIINIKKINDARYVNKFFEAINSKLDNGGLYINCVETYATRRIRVLKKYIRPFNWMYYTADVIFMRIFPKLPVTKKIYFFITRGKYRILTRAETFGRLYSCGFEIVDEKTINNKLYFVARKIKEPFFDKDPSYGLMIRLKRVGKNGTLFNVYKLRTMHAYAEYLQEYVHQQHNLKEGGKFNNDFRITPQGKLFRKFWIDEIPMLINLLKGNMKLVGVRPLSAHYFKLYSKELQEKRIQHKPGLVPPYYADMPKNLDEIMASEMRYLEACDKNSFITDVRYFFKAFKNIIIKGARSS